MSQLLLPAHPQEATKLLLKKLSSRRMRDILEKRFALKGGKKKTLDAVGKEYKVTRERVRQIEAEALKQLSRPENLADVEPMLLALHTYIQRHGDVVAEHDILAASAESYPQSQSHVTFLLNTGKSFYHMPETERYHDRWATSKESAQTVEKVLASAVKDMEQGKRTVAFEELRSAVGKHAHSHLGKQPSGDVIDSYIKTSKMIAKNPYGEYGLINWSMVSPRGVKDKSYLALAKADKPLHFREVAQAIEKAGWSKKRVHPQTVHNELIKDARFVLVGRGIYALKQWGYEPGVVKDVLVSVLKKANKPMSKDDIIKFVSDKRMVKPQTILLNLQDKSLFKRTDGGGYTLA